MNTLLLAAALLAPAPTPPEVDAAIRDYYRQFENAAFRQDQQRREAATPDRQPPGAVGAYPLLYAVIRPGSTAPVTSAAAGEPLVLLGENLPPNGTVYIAQREATVTSRTPTAYQIRVPSDLNPADPRPLKGAVDLFVGNQWSGRLYGTEFEILKAAPAPEVTIRARVTGTGAAQLRVAGMLQSGPLTLMITEVQVGPTPPPPPPPPLTHQGLTPTITGVRGAASGRATAPISGDTIIVSGHGFGTVRGRVKWGVVPVEPTLWTDTEIRFVMPPQAGGVHERGQMVSVRVGEKWITTGAFIP